MGLLKPDSIVRSWAQGTEGGRRPLPTHTAGGARQPQPGRVGVGKLVSVSRSFWKESQGAPRLPPPTWGRSVRMPCAAMAGQVAKGAGFTFPRGTTVAWSLPVPPGPAFPELVTEPQTKELILSRKGGTSILRSGPRQVSPPPCLPGEVSPPTPSSCSCRGIYSSPACSLPPGALGLGPLLAPRAPSP